MSITVLALLLLVGRIISMTFNVLVLTRQWKLRRIPTHPRLMSIRRVLTALAVIIFIGNIYPFALDIITMAYPQIRTTQTVNFIGVAYTLDVNLTFMFASIFIWALYKLADVAIEVGELIAGNPPKEVEVKPKNK